MVVKELYIIRSITVPGSFLILTDDSYYLNKNGQLHDAVDFDVDNYAGKVNSGLYYNSYRHAVQIANKLYPDIKTIRIK